MNSPAPFPGFAWLTNIGLLRAWRTPRHFAWVGLALFVLLVTATIWRTRAAGTAQLKLGATASESQAGRGLSLASADFDEDGVTDLMSGWSRAEGRNELRWQHGLAVGQGMRQSAGERGDEPFAEARVIPVGLSPDYVGAGDFNADGHADLVVGARGGNKLVWLAGNGRGVFAIAGESQLPGALRALAVGEVNRPDSLPEVVLGLATPDGAGQVLVLEGPNGAGQARAEGFATSGPVSGLALGMLDGDAMPDVAIAAGRELLLIAGRDRKLSLRAEEQATVRPANVSRRGFPTSLRDVALGDFKGDGRLDAAVLRGAGRSMGRRRAARRGAFDGSAVGECGWHQRRGRDGTAAQAGSDGRRYGIGGERASALGRDTLGRSGILPLRLNGDALDDLAVLRPGESAPVIVPSMPSAIITVNSTLDNNVHDNVLTLREGILLANGELLKSALTLTEQLQVSGTPAPELDEVRFNIQAGNNPEEMARMFNTRVQRATQWEAGFKTERESPQAPGDLCTGFPGTGLNGSADLVRSIVAQPDGLITLFNSGGRGAVMFRLAEDNAGGNPINNRAFIDAEYNRAFVTTQYFGYLRRDADMPGLNFWLSVVNQFPLRSRFGQNGMVCAFTTSTEYQVRFGPGVTRSNQSDCLALTGRITDGQNNGVSDVNITLSGALFRTVTSDAAGYYSLDALTSGGNYTVTPASPIYTFTPPRIDFVNLHGSQPANFTVTLISAPSIPPPVDDFTNGPH